jgi:hypothetical protein
MMVGSLEIALLDKGFNVAEFVERRKGPAASLGVAFQVL